MDAGPAHPQPPTALGRAPGWELPWAARHHFSQGCPLPGQPEASGAAGTRRPGPAWTWENLEVPPAQAPALYQEQQGLNSGCEATPHSPQGCLQGCLQAALSRVCFLRAPPPRFPDCCRPSVTGRGLQPRRYLKEQMPYKAVTIYHVTARHLPQDTVTSSGEWDSFHSQGASCLGPFDHALPSAQNTLPRSLHLTHSYHFFLSHLRTPSFRRPAWTPQTREGSPLAQHPGQPVPLCPSARFRWSRHGCSCVHHPDWTGPS